MTGEILLQIVMAMIGALGFGLLFHISGSRLITIMLGAAVNWGVYLLAMQWYDNRVTAFFVSTLATAALAEVLARFPTLAFEVYHDDCRIHAMNPNRYIRNHEHLTRSPVQVVERFTDIDLPIIKILFEEDFPVLDAVRTFILSRPWGREYELIYSNEHLLELTAAGATKGGMILRLASLLGVARKDIYCIDHKNDIPMLEVSAVPFAPANAIPAVHEFGAHIVSHCSDGAVADVVEYLDKIY